MLADTIEEYNSCLSSLKDEFRTCSDAINYVTTTWLDHTRNDSLLVGQICIFTVIILSIKDRKCTCQIEKATLTSQGNFETCWSNIHFLLELQHTDIRLRLIRV